MTAMLSATFLVHLIAVDHSLGRIDKSDLPQQTLMELLIANIENKTCLYHLEEDSYDITRWAGIVFDDFDEVQEIIWTCRDLRGSIDFKWLPPSTQTVRMKKNQLEGSLDLTCLPEFLKDLWMYENSFTGTLSLEYLPFMLEVLDVSTNRLSGTVNLTQLPSTLKRLYLHCNRFAGRVDVTKLPLNLSILYLHENLFEGKTDFSHLPASLTGFTLNSTNLSGEVVNRPGTSFVVHDSGVRLIDE